MGLPISVTSDQLRAAQAAAKNAAQIRQDEKFTVTEILASRPPKSSWEPVLVWSASQFMEESVLFMLAVQKYKTAPTQQKMDYIHKHFVGHGKRLADRAINIPSDSRERVFELVTGAQTRARNGGCRADAFDTAIEGLNFQLKFDINNRFGRAVAQPTGTYSMTASQKTILEQELADFDRLGMNL
jgi:hypothetical protein